MVTVIQMKNLLRHSFVRLLSQFKANILLILKTFTRIIHDVKIPRNRENM